MTVKVYSQYCRARKAQGEQDIIQVGSHYVVGLTGDLTSISVINKDGHQKGTVTVGHLKRLGNANWAQPRPSSQLEFMQMVTKDFIGQNWAQFIEYCTTNGHNTDLIKKCWED
jgi:hypothetical protein